MRPHGRRAPDAGLAIVQSMKTPEPRSPTRSWLPLLAALWLLAGLGSAWAQSAGRSAELELGFGGAVVADAWNPLRLVLRDVGPVVLELAIDRGTLREGERWSRYSLDIPGGSGLSVFEDEVFVPVWRSLSWTVRSGGLTVASGSVPRTQADRRPLALVVGEPGPLLRAALVGGRSVDLTADRLPLRSAAFDGVASLIVATPAARPQALIAAAVAGADVVLTSAARADATLAAFLPEGAELHGVGTGRFLTPAAWQRSLTTPVARLDQAALVSALAAAERITPPRPVPLLPLLLAAAVYALTVLLVLRFGGLPGLMAALLLALAAGIAAWVPLRPPEPTIDQMRELVIGADGVGQRWRLHEVLTLPSQTIVVPVAGWPLSYVDARLGPDQVAIDLGRWRSVRVLERPRATGLALRQEPDGSWRNAGERPLELVVVRGDGAVRNVPAGALVPEQTRDVQLPDVAVALLELLPDEAALASDGLRWMVALPQGVLAQVGP